MAYAANRTDGSKGRSEDKTQIGKSSSAKAESTLSFTLTAGALGLSIALLDQEKAAAANADSALNLSLDSGGSSTFSLTADQAILGTAHSAIVGHATYDGHSVSTAAIVAQSNEEPTPSGDAEGSSQDMQQLTEAAASSSGDTAGGSDHEEAGAAEASADPMHDVGQDSLAEVNLAMVATSTHASFSVAASQGGKGLETQGISSATSSGSLIADSTIEARDLGDMVGAVSEIGNELPGGDGVHSVVPAIVGAADGVTDALLGGGDEPGVVTAVLDDTLSTVGSLTDPLLGGGDRPGVVTAVLDDTLGTVDDLTDTLLGEGDESGVVGGALNTVSNVVGGLLGGADNSDEAAAETASTSDTGATEGPVETAVQTEPASTDANSEAPSNIFEAAANAVLQITENVADSLTPKVSFVGQPTIDTDAHSDTDNPNGTLHHEAA